MESAHRSDHLVQEIESSQADLVIFRAPAGETTLATALQCRGHVVIHADTLVYYSIDLRELDCSHAESQVQLATEEHREAIAGIATSGFANYRAHYAANPLLPKDLILSGYVEWSLSRLQSESQSSQTWVVSDEGTVAGFATCDVAESSVEIVLNAVHPDFERRGLYGKLLRHIQHHYAQQSVKELLISTQIWNYTVQRQWARAGLRLFKAYDTYHVDRRLTSGVSNP
ncbi:GNAT family N-acetyltransferase [Lysobacter soli]|uniref:GNAT family N-acetyltransferase n=1 Tax=Lysobacter soli TaxID=453783 RepID=UPI003673DCA3